MDFLQKVDFMMKRYSLNKRSLSQKSGIPYTTIDGWYKKGYEGMKLSTLRVLSDYFNTILDYWVDDSVSDPNYWKANGFIVNTEEMGHIQKYRVLDEHGKEVVDGALELEYKRVTAENESEAAAGRWRAGKQAQLTKFLQQKRQAHPAPPREEKVVRFTVPQYQEPMSAGCGEVIGTAYEENIELVKEPPRGTSFIAKIKGDSMEPTYHDGEWVFIHAQTEIQPGQVGVFYMDGKEWIKELGKGELISHNPAYPTRPMTDDICCQGLVLGVCDASYFA